MSKVLLSDLGEFKNGLNYSAADAVLGRKIIGVSNFDDKYVAEYDNLGQIDSTLVTKDYVLEDGDILFVRSNGNKALIGRTMIIQDIEEAVGFSGFCIRFRPNQELCYPLYILYLLKSPTYRKLFSNTQQTNISNLNQSILGDIEFELPVLQHQKVVADNIHLITQKIQLNNKIIAELESTAKTIYDYWFVQFDFPDANGNPYSTSGGEMVWNEKLKREIPKGWGDGFLIDIANILMGQSPDGKSYNENGDGMEFFQGCTDFGRVSPTTRMYTTAPSRTASDRDILLSVRAPVGTINLASNQCCIGRGLAALHSKQNCNVYLLNQIKALKPVFDVINNNGTTFGSLTKDTLYEMKILLPPVTIMEQYELSTSNSYDRIVALDKENQQLTALRDWLLPMLMNGQARVE